ncbi:hypothetical protein NPIL_637621 [Nephila pilipes]|uniref:Uncharacterized protein n=1 Tax=Nephila pilipes TaxID=299642 RepID=A0A8X6U753_NEPPI|nr:hypothetical protein NPIL_637621 [Nephila pilipes]
MIVERPLGEQFKEKIGQFMSNHKDGKIEPGNVAAFGYDVFKDSENKRKIIVPYKESDDDKKVTMIYITRITEKCTIDIELKE